MSNYETVQMMLEMPIGSEKVIERSRIIRVPGGWIFTLIAEYTRSMETSVFVPEPKK